MSTYLSLFPQLIAGPIVRYETVEAELYERSHSFELFYKGMKRLIIGLAMKDEAESNNGYDSNNTSSQNNRGLIMHFFGITVMFITGLIMQGLEIFAESDLFMPTVLLVVFPLSISKR